MEFNEDTTVCANGEFPSFLLLLFDAKRGPEMLNPLELRTAQPVDCWDLRYVTIRVEFNARAPVIVYA